MSCVAREAKKHKRKNDGCNGLHKKAKFTKTELVDKSHVAKVTISAKPKSQKFSCSGKWSKEEAKGYEVKSTECVNKESTRTTDGRTTAGVPRGVSSNWKALLKSGQVIYHKKPTAVKSQLEKVKMDRNDEVWFEVDDVLLGDSEKTGEVNTDSSLIKANSFEGLTKVIGMDCEMVGVGENGKDSILARVSVVNHFGHCVYDKYVKPIERVTDYRTKVSGIRPADIVNGEDFKVVQNEVSDLLKGRILVGHAIHNDLQVLFLSHPRKDTRDTSKYKPFRQKVRSGRPSLKKLTSQILGVEVQQGEHNSIQDAQAAMRLYTLHRKEWEKSLKSRPSSKSKHKSTLKVEKKGK